MWSTFEQNGILLPAGENGSSVNFPTSANPPPDVLQMMWNSAFSAFSTPESLAAQGISRHEAILQKHLCATSLLQQALSILSTRPSPEVVDNPIPVKPIGECHLIWYALIFESGIYEAYGTHSRAICRLGVGDLRFLRTQKATASRQRRVLSFHFVLINWDHLLC